MKSFAVVTLFFCFATSCGYYTKQEKEFIKETQALTSWLIAQGYDELSSIISSNEERYTKTQIYEDEKVYIEVVAVVSYEDTILCIKGLKSDSEPKLIFASIQSDTGELHFTSEVNGVKTNVDKKRAMSLVHIFYSKRIKIEKFNNS